MSNMMSNIDIYRIFRKIPDVSDDEAKQAAYSMVIDDQALTKADLTAFEAKMFKLALWAVAFNVTFTVTLTVSLIKLL